MQGGMKISITLKPNDIVKETCFARLCLHDSVIENVSDFSDFQVFRASPKTREEADFLHSLRLTGTHYDFWTEVVVDKKTKTKTKSPRHYITLHALESVK